jgi:hypothetical protein
MTYSAYNPSPREQDVINTAYQVQKKIRQRVARFVMPAKVPPTPYMEADTRPTLEAVPFGEIEIEGKHIRGKDGPSPVDGLWDIITYDGQEWLVKDGVVLKKTADVEETEQ